ncbi:hypothetical protein D048_1098 [Vibrio parahaemolyticus VPTS-2009]|nr:hypothetical protein D029_4750 [Vibrio parahaemolyticus 970107]EXJ30522.1 hypothetical protein D048_1098 [Vibrio parahaemolyticus VPTS-2009]
MSSSTAWATDTSENEELGKGSTVPKTKGAFSAPFAYINILVTHE